MPFSPLSAQVARSRLKSNLGALALLTFARTFFTPYLALRAAVVGVVDSIIAAPRGAKGWDWMWWIGEFRMREEEERGEDGDEVLCG
jgi:hypothetical protein